MTRSTVLRWVWFVLCAALAVAAGCATPVHVTWEAHAGGWSRSGTLELTVRPVAATQGAGGAWVVTERAREWPTPSEWTCREARGLRLPSPTPEPAPSPVVVEAPAAVRRGVPDLRRRRAPLRAKTTRLRKPIRVRGVLAPAPLVAPPPRALEPAITPSPPAPPAPALAPLEPRRASRREELAMLLAIVALALGTVAVPFFAARRRAR